MKAKIYRNAVGPSEHSIQSSFFEWINLQKAAYPMLDYAFAVPNGANKSISARMKFKREGLRAGIPDVCLPLASGRYTGLWLEFKAKRGVVSAEQKKWIDRLRNAGHRVEVVRDWETAVEIVKDYLKIK